MKTDHKIIRLTMMTSFFHSLLVTLLIILDLNSLLAKHYENGWYIGKVAQFFVQEMDKSNVLTRVLLITIFLFLAYSIIYPIGQSWIIHYLHDEKKNIWQALKKWRDDFFPMFEYGAFSMVFAPIVFFVTAFKILVVNGNHTPRMLFLMTLRFFAMTMLNTIKVFTRYIMTIEKQPVYESLKKSIALAIKNYNLAVKAMRIQTILLLNFTLNMFLILGIPLFLIYLSISRNIIQYGLVKAIIYLMFFLGLIFGSYISAIIRAFFAYYRFEIYKMVRKEK